MLCTSLVYAQPGESRSGTGVITGAVYDSTSQSPVEYANIVLYTVEDSSQVTGTITDSTGQFRLTGVSTGEFYLDIRFIGFKDRRLPGVQVESRGESVSLGEIWMSPSVLNSEGVVVEGERPTMEYKIDRKVIDVSSAQTSISGDAVDILENVPSIRVDIEGNVSLRGSQSFTVLIDGKSTPLDGTQALQQIPASSIETIEIITNPSVKYDPDGTAGIINVVLKDKQYAGSSGMIDLDVGIDNKYSGDALYQYKNGKYTITASADYGRRYYDGNRRERRQTTYQESTTHIRSTGSSVRGRNGGDGRLSLEYNINEGNKLTLQGRYGNWGFGSESEQVYREWTGDVRDDMTRYTSTEEFSRDGVFYSLSANYLHQFNQDGHEITAEFEHDVWDGSGESMNKRMNSDGDAVSGQRSVEEGPSRDYELEVEYVYPHGENRKFEAGYEAETDNGDESTEQYQYSTEQNEFIFQPEYSYTTVSARTTQSVFSLYSGEIHQFGYQLGVRGEYTYRNITHPDSGDYFNIDRWDYFPSLHFSYSFPGSQQLMASYSRRIERPRSWWLEPFLTWEDAYTVRRGNPSLVPEYVDSYEMGFQTRFGQGVFNIEAYYRNTNNKIERIRSVYAENVTLQTIDNVGQDFSFGTEFNFRYNILSAWDMNLMGDVYRYRVRGSLEDESFDRESYNWSTRLSNTIDLTETWRIQLDGRYQSPTVSSQGREEDYFRADLSVRKEFFNEKLAATLQVRDLFDTVTRERRSTGAGFTSYSYRDREAPIVMLNLQLNINNYEQQRGPGAGGGQGGMGPGGF